MAVTATVEVKEKVEKRVRPKAYLKNPPKEQDCYTPGCYNIQVEPCEGIPMSNRCASCKGKKMFMGIED